MFIRVQLCFLFFAALSARADALDAYVHDLLETNHLAGLSLVVIQSNQIVKAAGYGFAEKESRTPVTTNTLFEAGSISKPLATLGALHLVDLGKLALDEDVNAKLRSWKVPENKFTKNEKVTLRRILSHNAGLTVHGFRGYAFDETVPTLLQVLDGRSPANNSPIRVNLIPGAKVRYSGGGFTVMQELVMDVSGQPFSQYLNTCVLQPLGMTNSTFEQPIRDAKAAAAAHGYYANGSPVKHGWHAYPEIAAAGLWTTPSDLARYVIAVQQSFAGKCAPVISQSLTREMLTPQKENVGLGLMLSHHYFAHEGRNEGFDALLIGNTETGSGLVLMVNANDDTGVLQSLKKFIAREYRWPPSR
jgi:CubicO group peptidase (beta-lactamase class C family)